MKPSYIGQVINFVVRHLINQHTRWQLDVINAQLMINKSKKLNPARWNLLSEDVYSSYPLPSFLLSPSFIFGSHDHPLHFTSLHMSDHFPTLGHTCLFDLP